MCLWYSWQQSGGRSAVVRECISPAVVLGPPQSPLRPRAACQPEQISTRYQQLWSCNKQNNLRSTFSNVKVHINIYTYAVCRPVCATLTCVTPWLERGRRAGSRGAGRPPPPWSAPPPAPASSATAAAASSTLTRNVTSSAGSRSRSVTQLHYAVFIYVTV